MTILEAAVISIANNLPIRRASWAADKWFWVWRGGHWFSFPGGQPHTVVATDYTAADLLATDWTTVPAPLAACPITPTEPLGGNSPDPGQRGFASGGGRFPPPPGSGGGGGGGGSGSGGTLPTPNPGTSLNVDITGVTCGNDGLNFSEVDIDGSHSVDFESPGVWKTTFDSGYSNPTDPPNKKPVNWTLTLTKDLTTLKFTVSVTSTERYGGTFLAAFATLPGQEQLLGVPISNAHAVGDFGDGGTATVS
ncbi:hypothetical protein CfE428DRAFT_5784 [Chthoniobacter flavus Ellin428]|uniref:Uncharacterized protein n=1 Tax=Chthoniobacter flavus Ellin428 TaxID=497964 RepID=B4DA44_9BACT|nr:hypothetical protein [Chthoniobacter flavus]EDY16671.1 hypothetical protein CfE428DRAFT_5784 [Chthoniobacter flavus Ellin428]TCO87245.1 hypothetical protein EV701_12382 [Chthoniobacter flavus]